MYEHGKDALRIIVHLGGELSDKLFDLLYDKTKGETDLQYSEVIEVLQGEMYGLGDNTVCTSELPTVVLAITMMKPDTVGGWLDILWAVMSQDRATASSHSFGYLFGALDSINWLSEKGCDFNHVPLARVLFDFLNSAGVHEIGSLGDSSREAKQDRKLASCLESLVVQANSNQVLQNELAVLFTRCGQKNWEDVPFAQWFLRNMAYAFWKQADVTNMCKMIGEVPAVLCTDAQSYMEKK